MFGLIILKHGSVTVLGIMKMKSFSKVPNLFLKAETSIAIHSLSVVQSMIDFLFFLMPLFPLILILETTHYSHVFFHLCSHFLSCCFFCLPISVNAGYADKSWLSKTQGKVYCLPILFFHFCMRA